MVGTSPKLDSLKKKLGELIETSEDNVDILSVRTVPGNPGDVDVTYVAYGSPYYTPEKLNSIVAMNRDEVVLSYVQVAPLKLMSIRFFSEPAVIEQLNNVLGEYYIVPVILISEPDAPPPHPPVEI